MRDCRTCKHNSYLDIKDCKFVSCGHPITWAKAPRWEVGDPEMVNWRTADVHIRELSIGTRWQKCPCFEPMTTASQPRAA